MSVLVVEWLWKLQEPSAYRLVKGALRRSATRRALDLDKHSDNKKKSACYRKQDNVIDNNLIMAKPFIAARIPQTVADKLDERVRNSKQGKTDIIVNALAQYLGCSIDVPKETQAIDRLVAVEEELTKLRNRITALEKSSNPAIQKELLLNNNIVNEADKTLKSKKSSKQEIVQNNNNNIDKKSENTNRTDGSSDINSDNKSLTHHEMSKLTGMPFERVRGRYKKSTPIEWGGKQYIPIREGKRQKWQILDNKSD